MTTQEHIPDNFDAHDLNEPSQITLARFSDTCLRLDDLGEIDSPYREPGTEEDIDFYAVQNVLQKFNNGSYITNVSFHGSDEAAVEWSKTYPIHAINISTIDGTIYTYLQDSQENVSLFIDKLSERTLDEIDHKAYYIHEIPFNPILTRHLKPELIKLALSIKANQDEARRLGLGGLTEGNLKKLDHAIQSALESGIQNS